MEAAASQTVRCPSCGEAVASAICSCETPLRADPRSRVGLVGISVFLSSGVLIALGLAFRHPEATPPKPVPTAVVKRVPPSVPESVPQKLPEPEESFPGKLPRIGFDLSESIGADSNAHIAETTLIHEWLRRGYAIRDISAATGRRPGSELPEDIDIVVIGTLVTSETGDLTRELGGTTRMISCRATFEVRATDRKDWRVLGAIEKTKTTIHTELGACAQKAAKAAAELASPELRRTILENWKPPRARPR